MKQPVSKNAQVSEKSEMKIEIEFSDIKIIEITLIYQNIIHHKGKVT